MSLRKLARASAIYTLGNIAPKLGAFVLLPVYVRFLTPSEYGSVSLLVSVSNVLSLLLTFGVDAALMRLHFDLQGRERATLYSTLSLFSLVTSGVATLVAAAVLAPFFPQLFAGIPFWPLGALALLVAFANAVQYVPSVLFRATGQAGRFVLVNLSAFVIGSLSSVVLIVFVHLGAAGMLLGQLLGALAIFAIAIVIVSRLGPWAFSRSSLVAALRFGLPIMPHAIAGWALRLSDRWLIGLLIGLPVLQAQAAIGVYSFGYQIGFVVSIIVTSFNAAWSPYFFRVGHEASGPRLFREITTLVIAGLLVIAVGLAVLSPEIVTILANARYAEAVDVLPVIAFASVFQGLYTMLVTVVFLTKRTSQLALLTLASALLNLGLNVFLIPRLGIIGAAWSTLAAYAFFAIGTGVYGGRTYPIRLDLPRLALLTASCLMAVVVGRLTTVAGDIVAQGFLHLIIAACFAAIAAAIAFRPLLSLRGLTGAREL